MTLQIPQVSLLAVDEMHMNLPRMKKDIYWNDSSARPPYTLAAADSCIPSFLGSTIEMGLADSQFFHTENWLWEDDKPRRQQSMLRKVKRFLSVREASPSPSRRTYQRQSSDNSIFSPSYDPIGNLLEMHSRGRPFPFNGRKYYDRPDKNGRVRGSVDLGVIRETSKNDTLQTSHQSEVDGRSTIVDSPAVENTICKAESKEAAVNSPAHNSSHGTAGQDSGSTSESETNSEGLVLTGCGANNSMTNLLARPSEMKPPQRDFKPQVPAMGMQEGKKLPSSQKTSVNMADNQRWRFPDVLAQHELPKTLPTSSVSTESSPASSPPSLNKFDICCLVEQADIKEADILHIAEINNDSNKEQL